MRFLTILCYIVTPTFILYYTSFVWSVLIFAISRQHFSIICYVVPDNWGIHPLRTIVVKLSGRLVVRGIPLLSLILSKLSRKLERKSQVERYFGLNVTFCFKLDAFVKCLLLYLYLNL